MRLFAAAVLAAALIAGNGRAQGGANVPAETMVGTTVEDLLHELGRVQSARARFVEQRRLRILEVPVESSGLLVYQAPGKLEKITLTPTPERMSIDGDRLTIERVSEGVRHTMSLSERPELRAIVDAVRATLSGDLAALRRYYDVTFRGPMSEWLLELRPIEGRLRELVTSVRLSGRGSSITVIETIEADGDQSIMRVVEDPR